MSTCPNCGIRPKKKHHNSKWCKPCADGFRKRPRHTLTLRQQRMVRSMAGQIEQDEIARRIGVSRANVIRFARDADISLDTKRYPNHIVRAVTRYYSKHGRIKTEKRFPGVKVRSIVERYNHKPRQIRWTNKQIIQAAQMAGLVSPRNQAKFFNRPNAGAGSIKSLWIKRFGLAQREIAGMSYWNARHIVTSDCPRIKVSFAWIYLWCDMEKHLRRGTPRFIRDAVRELAKFQRWLYQSKNPRKEILRIIREQRV